MSYLKKSVIWVVALLAFFSIYSFSHAVDLQTSALLFAVCFFSELVDSSLGMGYGTMLTPLLLLCGFSPIVIIPNLLFSELFTGFAATFFHHQIQNIDLRPESKHLKIAAYLILGSLIGVSAGVWIALSIPPQVMVVLIGCIIFFSGFVVLLFYDKVIIYRSWKIVLLASIASFNKAFSGGGYGPLVTSGQILSGIPGKSSVAITSLSEGFTCLFGVAIFHLHNVNIELSLLVPMVAGALISVPFSAFFVSRTKEHYLRIIVGALTMALGAYTIYSVVGTLINGA